MRSASDWVADLQLVSVCNAVLALDHHVLYKSQSRKRAKTLAQ